MLTYLWNKNDGGYVGLDGTTYDSAPTAEEIVALQQYSQRFVNDEEGYRNAYNSNVAPKLGTTSPYAYQTYYNTDDSCLPDICKVNVRLVNDGGDPDVKANIYTADTGCRVLDFVFYNLCGDCMGMAGSQNVYVRYTNQDCIDDNGGVCPPRSCMFTDAVGHNVMGLLITDDPSLATEPCNYAWFQSVSESGLASSFVSYVFTRSVTKPNKPVGGSYYGTDTCKAGMPCPNNGVWYDSVPGQNNYPIWMSFRTFWSDEDDVIEHHTEWSDPACMNDTKTFQTEWAEESTETMEVYLKARTLPSLNEERFRDPSNLTEGINEEVWRAAAASQGCGNWTDDAEGATFMAWSNCRNGIWDDWTVARIRGEAGEAGKNAGRTFMIFASLPGKTEDEQDIIPDTPTGGLWDIENNVLLIDNNPPLRGTDNFGNSVTWSPDNNTIRGNKTWLSVGDFDGDYGRLIDPPGWSKPICITGDDGQDGVDGDNIEFIYARFEDVSAFTEYYNMATDVKSEECAAMLAARDVEHSKKGTPWEERDYIPYDPEWKYEWFDHPQGIGEDEDLNFWRVEACCVREKTEVEDPDNPGEYISQWGDWVGPFIWASWGEDGIDGDGVEYIFCVTTKADRTCRWRNIESSKLTEDDIASAVIVDTLPNLDMFSAEECDETPTLVHVNGEDATLYHLKETVYLFPEEPFGVNPPLNFNEACVAEDGCYRCADSLYRTLCAGEADYDLKKKILWEFYQESEFVPSNDRITSELTDHDSHLYKVLERNDALGKPDVWYDFLKAWDANWTDNPLDVGPQQPYEWVSIRKYKRGPDEDDELNKEWQAFSTPKLWANWAFDGTATYTSMVFTRTNDDISGMELCGGTMEMPYPGAGDTTESDSGCTQTYDVFKRRSEVKYACPECEGKEKTYFWYDTVPADIVYDYAKLENGLSDIPEEYRNLPSVTTPIAHDNWPDPNDLTDRSPEYIAYVETDLSIGYYHKTSSPLNACIWMATRIFGDYVTGQSQGWSSPRRMSDTSDFNVEWCTEPVLSQTAINKLKSSTMNFTNFVKEVEEEGIADDELHTEAEARFRAKALEEGCGVWSDTGDGAVYMATTTCRNGKWSNWTVSKIKGEKGDTGIGITLYGSTKGVVLANVSPTCLTSGGTPSVGDIYGVVYAGGQDAWNRYRACDESEWHQTDFTCDGCEPIDFFEYVGGTKQWVSLACKALYRYEVATKGEYDAMVIDDSGNTGEYATMEDAPDPYDDGSPMYIHLVGTDQEPLDEYYVRVKRRLAEEGITIVINGITEENEGCQGTNAQAIEALGFRNGDFCIWDTDSWRVATNLMGPSGKGSFVHIKYASKHIADPRCTDATQPPCGYVYELTPATQIDGVDLNPGEAPGTYMGIYVDENKGDRGASFEYQGKSYINDEYYPTAVNEGPGPYKWTKVEGQDGKPGQDGLGYEYIYVTSLTDEVGTSGNKYVTGGKPLVPYFSESFYTGSTYQANGFVPTAAYSGECIYDSYCVQWSDNPVGCDIDDRFRWKCYRMKINGVWSQFIGDKSTSSTTLTNGRFATFDANYSVDGESVVIADFENDTIAVGCTEDGKTAEQLSERIVPQLYKGSTALTVTGFSYTNGSVSGVDVTFTDNAMSVTVHKEVLVVPSVKVRVTLRGYYTNEYDERVEESGEACINIIGIKGSAIYSLVVSKSSIKRDTDGNLIDGNTPLTVTVLKREVGTSETVPADATTGEYYVTCQEDDASEHHFSNDDSYDTPAKQDEISEKVVFRLYTKINSNGTWEASNRVLNDVETIYVVSDGERGAEGSSPFLADLDNELDSIPLTYEGAVDAGEDAYVTACTVVSAFYGSRRIEFATVCATTEATDTSARELTTTDDAWTNIVDANIQGRRDDNLITFRVKNGWTGFPDDPLEIRLFVPVRYGTETQTCSITFTLAGVKAGSPGEAASLYSLYPTTSFFSKREDGTIEPGSINCKVLKKNGKEVEEVTNLAGDGLKIIYTTDDNENSYRQLPSEGISGTPVQGIDKYIKFVLVSTGYTSTSTPALNQSVDIESVPVVKDGKGTDGRAILAKTEYWCANNFEAPSDPGFPAKETLGTSPTGWTMTGQYFADDDEQCRHRLNATGTIPIPTEEYPNLWKWEKYWYSDGDHYTTDISLVSSLSDEITAIETWYKITLDNEDAKQAVLDMYDEVTSHQKTPLAAGFTNLATTPPRELGMVGDECEVRWQFNMIVYAQKPTQCLGIGIVDRYYKPLMDIDILKGMFGEANVQGKKGAYLREFLGVMGRREEGDTRSEEEFYNADVKAFMNATYNWYKDPITDTEDEYKGRVMFAAGVTNLGSQNNHNNTQNWDDISGGTNPDGVIDIDKFRATTVIWEGGELDCNKAVVSGTINAYSGSFGGRPGTSGCVKIGEDGLHGYDANNTTELFSFTSNGVEIGGENDALHIDSSGITGKTNQGAVLFQLDGNGLVANKGTFNGDVNATSLKVSNNHTVGQWYYENTLHIDDSEYELYSIAENLVGSKERITAQISTRNGIQYATEYLGTTVSGDNVLEIKPNEGIGLTTTERQHGGSTGHTSVVSGGIYVSREAVSGNTSKATSINAGDISLGETVGGGVNFRATNEGMLFITGAYGSFSVWADRNPSSGYVSEFSGGVRTYGNIMATAFYESSDARLKNVGEPLTNVLDKLESIPTVYYKWKDHRDDDSHIGTLAQSLSDTFPEVVGGDEENGYTVDYAKLSIIALAAIKELKGEVDMLKNEIRRLKDKSDAR